MYVIMYDYMYMVLQTCLWVASGVSFERRAGGRNSKGTEDVQIYTRLSFF